MSRECLKAEHRPPKVLVYTLFLNAPGFKGGPYPQINPQFTG